MQDRYWMFRHKGTFYVQDKLNGKQKSLRTRDPATARRMFFMTLRQRTSVGPR